MISVANGEKIIDLEFYKENQDQTTIIYAKNEEDKFVVKVQTTTAQIDLTYEILDEILNNALFDDYEIEKKRHDNT